MTALVKLGKDYIESKISSVQDYESFGADDTSTGIPGDIRGALRKMGKKVSLIVWNNILYYGVVRFFLVPSLYSIFLYHSKDAVTKQKAVAEFCALCESASAEAVLSVLPFWPRIYAKIAVDNDRRYKATANYKFDSNSP